MSLVLVSLGQGQAQHSQQARHLMEIRFSVLVVLIVFLALNAAVQLSTLAAVQGLAAQQYAVSPPGTDAAALEIALNERRLAFVLATDAKFDEPTNPDLVRNAKTRPATNRWCTKWELPMYFKESLPLEPCSAANMVLMNDVDMVIEIAKELGWKDLKQVAVFGSKAWLDNPYTPETPYQKWKIFEEKKSQLENYDLKFDSNLSGFIENHVEFEQRRYREASFHVKAKLCGLTFSTTWQGAPVLESRPIETWHFRAEYGISGIPAALRHSGELYYRTVKWGS